jgi:hypothetical protein
VLQLYQYAHLLQGLHNAGDTQPSRENDWRLTD